MPIVFDGTEASAVRVRALLWTANPRISVHHMGNALHVHGRKFEAGTSFDVVLPDEILICPPAAVKTINMEFKI